jgi:hypothetical protein
MLLSLALLVVLLILVPGMLIRPFAPQTPAGVSLSFLLRRWSPLVSLLGLLGGLWLAAQIWRGSRIVPRIGTGLLVLLLGAGAWLARQDYFEWMFAPLPDARFVRVAAADFVQPNDLVIAATLNGESVAYPVRQIAYHHLVEDAIGKVPIVATY